MAKQLTLNLSASEIKQAIKSDTYITGQIDKSADMVKNAVLAYNEQAGDESYHNAKLFRTMKGALAKFEAQLAEYVETSSENASITDSLSSQDTDAFTITITVGSRTSAAFVTTLAYLAQEFIINTSLYYWWQPIKPTLAKDYLAFAAENIGDVRRCLAKSAPSASGASYDDISGTVQEQTYLSFPQEAYNAQIGEAFEAPALSKFPSGLTGIEYSSSDEGVATVDETTGAITLVSDGTTIITASYAGSDDYTASHASYTLNVATQQNNG